MTTDVTQGLDPSTPDPALALVEACRRGDEAAWRALYDEHFDFAYRTARRLGVATADVEDVVHDAFEVAWGRLDRFRWGRFSSWLYQIVSHVVSAHLRRKRVRAFFTGWLEPSAPSPESAAEARSDLDAVERLLAKLSPKKREVFVLFELEGFGHHDIAELLGCPPETVRTRLHAARRELETLARDEGVWP